MATRTGFRVLRHGGKVGSAPAPLRKAGASGTPLKFSTVARLAQHRTICFAAGLSPSVPARSQPRSLGNLDSRRDLAVKRYSLSPLRRPCAPPSLGRSPSRLASPDFRFAFLCLAASSVWPPQRRQASLASSQDGNRGLAQRRQEHPVQHDDQVPGSGRELPVLHHRAQLRESKRS